MASKPKVLILTADFPPATGGIQLVIHRLAATMSRLDPLVVAPRSGRAASAFDRSSPVRVKRVRTIPTAHRATIGLLNTAALIAARQFKPDIVLSAHIVTSPAAAAIRNQLGIPVVQYLYASEIGMRPRLARFAVGRSDATIAISRHTWDLAQRTGADERKLKLIPPGVDLPDRRPQPRAQVPTIVTVARLEERYKGHDTLIRSLPLILARRQDVEWIVIGDGPRRTQLERLASIYGVRSSTRFLGQLSDQERDGWLERAHVFAMPSRIPADGLGGEGFGIVYVEANWHELPVVAGNTGGAVDAVVDGETGLLVDANDPMAVADAITTVLLDDDLRARLGVNGALRARNFAWPLITERVENVLLELAAGRVSSQSGAR